MSKVFTGSGKLLRFILRKDRVWLLVWILSLTVFTAGFVPVFEDLLLADGEATIYAQMMENPAMIAMVGPVYGAGNYTTGAAYSNMMLVFCVMIAGAMNVFLVSRHTRQDEETGRLELIRSMPVGRLANLTSVWLTVLLANGLLTILCAAGLYALKGSGMTWEGCLLFGASLGIIGVLFAAVTTLFAQLNSDSRTVNMSSLLLMLAFYVLRGAGDLYSETLARISPLGLVLRTEIYVNNYWWPIGVLLGISMGIALLALWIAEKRDLGQGVFSDRLGRSHGSAMLSSPLGLSIRLIRTPSIIWAITIFVLAGMYASVFGELESFIQNNEMLKLIFSSDPRYSVTEQFIGLLNAIMAMIATIPALSTIHRLAGEEKQGRAELILSRAVSKRELLSAYLLPAFILSILLQILTPIGFWSIGRLVASDLPSLETFLISSLIYLPAIWVMLGISALLVAIQPGKTGVAYLYLGFTFIIIYIGTMIQFPDWLKSLSPFGHISNYPIEEIKPLPLVLLTGISALLVLLSNHLYRNRSIGDV